MKRNPVLFRVGVFMASVIATASLAIEARAADIRSELPADLIAKHCIANGIGSNVDGVFMLADGRRLTGQILCGAKDMVAPVKIGSGGDDDEGENEGDDD